MRLINTLVVHTAASPKNRDSSVDALRRYHVGVFGWSDVAYHAVITQDGTLQYGRPESRPGAGIKGPEPHVLNVCCTGHGDLADFTDEQKATLARYSADKVEQYAELEVVRCIGHREAHEYGFPRQWKSCPGKMVDCDEIRDRVRQELQAQGYYDDHSDTEPAPPLDLEPINEAFEAQLESMKSLGDLVRSTIARTRL